MRIFRLARMCGGSRVTSAPSNSMRPPADGTSPMTALRIDVFPAPFAPMIDTSSPSFTEKEAPETAVTPA